jgi:transposase
MYDHYIAFDWAQNIVAVARMTKKSEQIHSFETESNVNELKTYLKSLSGTKKLTVEESTPAQWLYAEFKDCVDDIVICDPRRNHLLTEGPKNDRIDAEKLVKLLRANLLKPVYHSCDQFIFLRKVVSGYEDLVKAGVRFKNQRSALFRSKGKNKDDTNLQEPMEKFVLKNLDQNIDLYETQKKLYEKEFTSFKRKYKIISNLSSIPGIGDINAVKVAAIVVDASRFPNKGKFLSYCGLVKLDRISGGRIYGKKKPQFDRRMKSIFKIAALVNTFEGSNSYFNRYYKYLIKEKQYPEYQARHAVARRVAIITYGVMKQGKKWDESKLTLYTK